ncbi:MAG: hypothetical protein BZ138_00515 [Methanosphaera sp. rholeuAM270]|nr:MAG: hypothetical protein BZ138_00515 [Methanosphaera sp. rholeuAM270]
MYQNKISHNLFISYYHVDRYFRDKLNKILEKHFKTSSSPHNYAICHNFQKYTEELRKSTTHDDIFIVLVGKDTYKSQNVDWEIDYGLHENACILGLCLPTNDDYLKKDINPKIIPEKLVTNIYSGYASYFDWTENYEDIQTYINIAIKNKLHKHALFI